MENNTLVLKNRLKNVRAEKNLSQMQLAEIVGVSRNSISSIETGQFNQAIARARELGMSPPKGG